MAAPTPPTGSAYVFLGHGSDSGDFNSRQTVPEGYMFVTAAQCGNVTDGSIHILFRRLAALGNKIYNPVTYREEIEEALQIKIHVYQPGDKLPSLQIAFPATIVEGNEVKYYPSGVFKLPYPYAFDDIQKTQTANAEPLLQKLFFSEDNLLKAKMRADIPKSIQAVKGMANIPSMIKELKIRYTLQKLLEYKPSGAERWIPKGVYYHFLCRAYQPIPGKLGINERILQTRRKSIVQQYSQMGKLAPAYNEKPYVLVKRISGKGDEEEGYDTFEEAYNAYTSLIAGFKLYNVKAPETVKTALNTTNMFEDGIIQPLKIPHSIVIIKRKGAKGGKRTMKRKTRRSRRKN
jgi:hypothetical protein